MTLFDKCRLQTNKVQFKVLKEYISNQMQLKSNKVTNPNSFLADIVWDILHKFSC